MANNDEAASPGARLRAAVEAERPVQVAGAITAYAGRMAQATGFRALFTASKDHKP
jgi:methylisocitrate lyase